MNKNIIKASAFILIGGESKRFGHTKWQVMLEGETILDRIWKSCRNFEYRYIIGKNRPLNLNNKPFLQDKLKIQAPINGLYTALNYSKTDWIMLLSCDLPLANADIFNDLWCQRDENLDIIIPFANNKYQVTCAFYHKRIMAHLFNAIKTYDYSLYRLLLKLESKKIPFNNDNRFWNMNTKQEYQRILNFVGT